jgi:EpsI family protein
VRIVALPTAFLLFAMPMPAPLLNASLFRMQFWTAEFSGAILHAVGVSAFVTGDQVLREGDNFAIIETCSGVRIVETLTMLTILMLDLFRRRSLHSAILLALTPAVAFLCNGLRAVTLMLNPRAEITEVHTLQGIGMLLAGLLVLYAIDGILGRLLPSQPAAESPAGPGATDGAARAACQWRAATVVLAAFAAVSLTVPAWQLGAANLDALLVRDFTTLDGWVSSEVAVDRRFLGRIGLQRDLSRRYVRNGEAVKLYAAVGQREFRARSVLFSKAELPGSGWNTREQGRLRLEPGGIEARWRVLVSGARKEFVVYWSEAGAGLLKESLRSLLGLDRSPLRRPGEALVVRLATPMTDPEPAARELAEARIRRFYAALRPQLDAQHAILRGDTT